MYVLPLQTTSLMAYKRLLYAMMLVNALGLYGRHGRLRFNTEVRRCLALVYCASGSGLHLSVYAF